MTEKESLRLSAARAAAVGGFGSVEAFFNAMRRLRSVGVDFRTAAVPGERGRFYAREPYLDWVQTGKPIPKAPLIVREGIVVKVTARHGNEGWSAQSQDLTNPVVQPSLTKLRSRICKLIAEARAVDPSLIRVELTTEAGGPPLVMWQVATAQERQGRDLLASAAASRREAVRMYLDQGMTMEDAAEVFGVTAERVRQLGSTPTKPARETR